MDIDWPVLIGCMVLALAVTVLNGGSGSSTRSSRRTGRRPGRGFGGGGGRFSSRRRSFSGGGGRFSSGRTRPARSKSAVKRRRR